MKRDEKGHVILQGARTFGTSTVKPTGGRRQPRYYGLRDKSSNYFANVIDFGKRNINNINPEQFKDIKEHNDFARLSKEVKLHYYYAKISDLKNDLEQLNKSKNIRKINFMKPVIEQELKEAENNFMELYEVIGD